MRIIAGTLKGRRLAAPSGQRIRPTSDKLRETLFNVLTPRVQGARVLDGFAGTGALGLEALSRGAAHVTMVERSRAGLELIEENLRRCRVVEGCAIIRAAMDEAVERLAAQRFDLILLDPPYDHAQVSHLLDQVGGLLADDGLLVLEHARRDPGPAEAGALVRQRQITSGDSALSLYAATAVLSPTTNRDQDVDA